MPKILVIGYGNPLCGDDGVAWHVVEALEALANAWLNNIFKINNAENFIIR